MFRMRHADTALACLMKLKIEEWQKRMPISDELKKSTEKFRKCFKDGAFSCIGSNIINNWRQYALRFDFFCPW